MSKKRFLLVIAAYVTIVGSTLASGATVVAYKKWVGQTTPLPSTAVYTATTDGLYRVSSYAEGGATYTSGTDAVAAWFLWTDDYKTPNPGEWATANIIGNQGSVQVIRLLKGKTLFVQTFTSFDPTGPYDLYVTVERLEK